MFVSAGSARYFSRSSSTAAAVGAVAAALAAAGGARGMAKKELEAPSLPAAMAEAVVTGAGCSGAGAGAGARARPAVGSARPAVGSRFQSAFHAAESAAIAVTFSYSRSVVQPGKVYVLIGTQVPGYQVGPGLLWLLPGST